MQLLPPHRSLSVTSTVIGYQSKRLQRFQYLVRVNVTMRSLFLEQEL
ncbi:hypothetical protein [Leptolyngbya sp. FACHB-671]|nr:hypothetical protein [Leptolyngbya sp. FACHB-671]